MVMLAILLCMTASLLTGCGDDDKDTRVVLTTGFARDELFKIDDIKCTVPEYMVYLTNMQNRYETVYGEEIWSTSVGGVSFEENIKDSALSKIAQVKTVVLLARSRGVVLDEDEQQAVLQTAQQYWDSLSVTERDKLGVTQEMLQNMYTEYALARKVYNDMIKDVNPEISDDEARTITVEQIFLKAYSLNDDGEKTPYSDSKRREIRAAAEALRRQAVDGADFEQLAIDNSNSEDITVSFGTGEVDSQIETAGFKLGNDEISSVIETNDGFYILKCLSTFNREETDGNKEKIVEKRKREAFNAEYEEFVKTVTKVINNETWDEIGLIHDKAVDTADFFEIFNENEIL